MKNVNLIWRIGEFGVVLERFAFPSMIIEACSRQTPYMINGLITGFTKSLSSEQKKIDLGAVID